MFRNRDAGIWDKYDPVGEFSVETNRRTALLAIEEVLAEAQVAWGESTTTLEPATTLPTPPAALPLPRRRESPWSRRRNRRRRTRRGRRRPLIVALTLGLALCIGALFGSGAFNATDRYNAQVIAAQEGTAQVYELREVQGHAGAAPSRERSASIREFLGMASAF